MTTVCIARRGVLLNGGITLVLLLAATLLGNSRAAGATAAPVLTASYPTDGGTAKPLGRLEVSGVGTVLLVATRKGTRLVINATATDGTALGRAESVVGLPETPLYIHGAGGLQRIVIRWAE
jgi:hypothetical protein